MDTIHEILDTAAMLRGLANMDCPQAVRESLWENAANLERCAGRVLRKEASRGKRAAKALKNWPQLTR